MPRIERLIFALRPRVGPKAYARLVWAAIRRHPLAWGTFALIACAGFVFSHYYWLRFTLTESMPWHLVLVEKAPPAPGSLKRGDLVAWRWPGGLIYPEGAVFLKVVKGLPGDQVLTFGRDFYVNGEYVGRAKAVSRLGQTLTANQPGTVPAGHYYLYAPHRDSLDSRYAATGYVAHERILGRAYGVF
jgi:conjugal transfer pilin signal peptidase TrbI